MELLGVVLPYEYLEKILRRRSPSQSLFVSLAEELLRRLHHIIKIQISHNYTRNLLELTTGVALNLAVGPLGGTPLASEFLVTVERDVTLPINIRVHDYKYCIASISPFTHPEFTNFSLVAFTYFVSLAILRRPLHYLNDCVARPHYGRLFTLILTIAFSPLVILLSVGYYAHLHLK